MAITLLAVNCPAVQTFGALIRRLDVYAGTASPPVGYTVPQPGGVSSSPLNANAWSVDMLGRYGGGGIGIGTGLVITAGTGLQCIVSAGHAVIDSPVENAAAFTVTGLSASARSWIWMQQNGSIIAISTSTTPPAMVSCLLGSVLTSASAVVQIDTSGVCYLGGSTLTRYTADPGVPIDTPPSNIQFRHLTPFGGFVWDGGAYRQTYVPSVTANPTQTTEGLEWFRSDTLTRYVYSGGSVVPFPSSVGGGSGVAATTVSEVAPTAAVGTSINFAREDHTHRGVHKLTGNADAFGDIIFTGGGVVQSGGTFTFSGGSGTPATTVTTTAAANAVGTSTNYAREDHVHRGISSVIGPSSTVYGDLTFTGAGVSQVGGTLTFSGSPTLATTSQAVGATSAAGTSANVAREDHIHAGVGSVTGPGGLQQGGLTFTGSGVSQSGTTFTFAGTGSAATTVTAIAAAPAVGTSASFARADHVHDGVHSFNTLKGDVTISAGAGVTLTPSGNNIAIAASGAAAVTPTNILVISPGAAALAWTVTTTLTEFLGLTIHRAQYPLGIATQARLVVCIDGAATVPTNLPTLYVQFSTNGGSTWNYLCGGTTPGVVFAQGTTVSTWAAMDARATADDLIRIVGSTASGTAAVQYGSIYVQVK
jgi:hypothetical protein